MLLLVKVPCIFVSTAGFWITFTPPQPPPAENEKAKSTALEGFFVQRSTIFTLKCIISGTALAEVAVLIAQHALDRHHPYSHFLLSHLILSNSTAERICVSRPFFVGTFMASLGGLIRYKCYRALGTMFTFEMSIRKDHMLVTSGPYSIVRHPGYTGVFLVVIGIFLVHGLKGSWVRESGILKTTVMKTITGITCAFIAVTILGILRRMSKEDEALHQLAGEKWEYWAEKVPYKLVPLIY
ncbi:hypothetical protein Ac2012v2_005362 [Leucoagaricus gongylophorus]